MGFLARFLAAGRLRFVPDTDQGTLGVLNRLTVLGEQLQIDRDRRVGEFPGTSIGRAMDVPGGSPGPWKRLMPRR